MTKLGSRKLHIFPKVTKMGSIIGHRIDYNGVGALRGQRHIPRKNIPKYLPGSAFYQLSNIAQISKHISFRHCETLIHAFVTSKIDHYNILLSGLRQDQVRKLQYVQNSTVRLLTGSRKHEQITPVLSRSALITRL